MTLLSIRILLKQFSDPPFSLFIHHMSPWVWLYTLISVTGTGHVKYQENPLASKLHGNSAWKIISFYLLYAQLHILMPGGHLLIMCLLSCIINDKHIFLSFGKDLHGQSSCHLYMAFQLLQNMASGHVTVKKGTGHVFYMATPSHATESVYPPVSEVEGIKSVMYVCVCVYV